MPVWVRHDDGRANAGRRRRRQRAPQVEALTPVEAPLPLQALLPVALTASTEELRQRRLESIAGVIAGDDGAPEFFEQHQA